MNCTLKHPWVVDAVKDRYVIALGGLVKIAQIVHAPQFHAVINPFFALFALLAQLVPGGSGPHRMVFTIPTAVLGLVLKIPHWRPLALILVDTPFYVDDVTDPVSALDVKLNEFLIVRDRDVVELP